MAPFDRLHTSSYFRLTVTVALPCIVSEIKRHVGRTYEVRRCKLYNGLVVRGRLCHILSFVVGKCFWHFARPAIFDSQLLDQNRDFCLYPTCIRRPR